MERVEVSDRFTVGIYVGNEAVSSLDFSRPERGNPGCGAAEYLPVALAHAMHLYASDSVHPVLYATSTSHLPSHIESMQVANIASAAREAKKRGVDFFVFRTRQSEEQGILDVLDELNLPAIGRADLTPRAGHLRRIAQAKCLRALVCVGTEQYDALCDTPASDKLIAIENGVFASQFLPFASEPRDPHLVTYLGALVPQKGFHLLVEAWPLVLRRYPRAKLKVIGSIKAYSQSASVGQWGVAAPEYEESWRRHISTPHGHPHSSVEFLGTMGAEKGSLLCRSTVGIVNPSGLTETSCVSAIELQMAGTPVVSGAYFALLDTVKHGKTGLLGRSVSDLAENILALLENPLRASKMGAEAAAYARERYDWSAIVPKWIRLFSTIRAGGHLTYSPPRTHLFRHAKYLRILNRPIQRTVGATLPWPTVTEMGDWVRLRIRSMTSETPRPQ